MVKISIEGRRFAAENSNYGGRKLFCHGRREEYWLWRQICRQMFGGFYSIGEEDYNNGTMPPLLMIIAKRNLQCVAIMEKKIIATMKEEEKSYTIGRENQA